MRLLWMLLLLFVGSACSTVRVVHLKAGDAEPVVHVPRDAEGAGPVELEAEAFEDAVASLARDVMPSLHPLRDARRRFGVPDRSGVYAYERRGQRLIPLEERSDGPRLLEDYADEELTRAYGQWCERRRHAGDCLRLLDEGPLLASDGKYTLAMAIAMDSVWEETAEALRGMADPHALMATMTASVSMYLLLWTLPEPVSKGLAALLTATAIAYLGVDTVWRVLDGWRVLVRQVERATTFAQLSAAGEAYGEVLGENAARIFVMLATAAIGNTAGLAAKSTRLPGSSRAALNVEAQAGYPYAALGGVESVAMTAEGFAIVLVPHAVAMTARGPSGAKRTEKHHIATNKNEVSALRGGPWTPRFRAIFRRAGMELKDPENIVPVKAHRGPHPREYHEQVLASLEEATSTCSGVPQCRDALTRALNRLAREVATPGTRLNMLVTSGGRR